MTDHTPGPWAYEYDNSDEGYGWWFDLTGGPNSQPLISGPYNNPTTTVEEAEANARLIAAAPELLKALTTISMHPSCSKCEERARTAITKATQGAP